MNKKKTVLLVSLWGNINYGNRLQSIALKHMIECEGFSALVVAALSRREPKQIKKRIKKLLGGFGIPRFRKDYLNSLRHNAIGKSSRPLTTPIAGIFYDFEIKSHINPDEYIAAITGSDQVWHKWTRNPKELPFFYLQFMPPEKRISFAASFGFETFPREDIDQHRSGLLGMNRISCREESGRSLVNQLTGRQAALVLDPTLCVGESFWMKVEEKPRYEVPEHYTLVFMLGNQDVYIEPIANYSREKHFAMLDLNDMNKPDYWRTSISNFIWLIHHADMICTDSFHCVAFSIIYEKKFTVFRRCQKEVGNMFDRIKTLLDMTDLQTREYNGSRIEDSEIDYKMVLNRLTPKVTESINWLHDALMFVHSNIEQ